MTGIPGRARAALRAPVLCTAMALLVGVGSACSGPAGSAAPATAREAQPLPVASATATAAPPVAAGASSAPVADGNLPGAAATPVRLPPVQPLAPSPRGVVTVASASIAAVGDVLMHGAVKDAAAAHRAPDNDDGFGWLWAPIADLLGAADVTFANLETPVAPRTDQGSRSFVFNASPSVIAALRHAGVDLVSVANNHIFDQGRGGFEETLDVLGRAGMAYVGAGQAGHEAGPRIVEANGLRIAFLGYAQFFNAPGNECPAARAAPCRRASLLDPERAVADVRAAARDADAVVVSVHWGEEYQEQPRPQEVALAHRLADAGALLVLGHHPHVLQPLELYSRADGSTALIAFSLGNFVSNQSRNYVHGVTPARVAATRDGVLLRAELARRDYGRGVTRVELAGADWLPLWTDNDTLDPARRAAGRRPEIRVVAVDRALYEVRRELAALPDPVPEGDRDRFLALRRREELLVSRRAAVAAVLGEDLQRVAPPPPVAAAPALSSPASR